MTIYKKNKNIACYQILFGNGDRERGEGGDGCGAGICNVMTLIIQTKKSFISMKEPN